MSAYLCFIKQNINLIKTENPGIVQADVMKKAAEQWAKMTPEQKQPYVQLSDADKARADGERA